VTRRIADEALRHLLAVKQGKPLPRIAETTRLKLEVARDLAGRYQSGDKSLDLLVSDGRLWLLPLKGGLRLELRAQGKELITDDLLGYGTKVVVRGDELVIDKDTYKRVADAKPQPPPARWLGLIGEYGWDHNTLYILERAGKLNALI